MNDWTVSYYITGLMVSTYERNNEWMNEGMKEWRNDRIGGMNKKTVDNE